MSKWYHLAKDHTASRIAVKYLSAHNQTPDDAWQRITNNISPNDRDLSSYFKGVRDEVSVLPRLKGFEIHCYIFGDRVAESLYKVALWVNVEFENSKDLRLIKLLCPDIYSRLSEGAYTCRIIHEPLKHFVHKESVG